MKKNRSLFVALLAVLIAVAVLLILFSNRIPRYGSGNVQIPDVRNETDEKPAVQYDTEGSYSPTEKAFDSEYEISDRKGRYLNEGVLECVFPSGSVFRIGARSDEDGLLYLNPSYECIEAEKVVGQTMTQFGFYVSCAGAEVICSSETEGFANSPENAGSSSLYIKNRTYDTLCPAGYMNDGDYGIGLKRLDDGTSPLLLSVRVVRFPDGHLMGIAHADMTADEDGTFRISGLRYGDVSVSGELDDESRQTIINKAVSFITDQNRTQSFNFFADYWAEAAGTAVVEKTELPYFSRLYSDATEVVSAGKFSNCDIYAVNFNQLGIGFVTIYFAPQMQLWGLDSTINPNTGDADLKIFGYDPLLPFSKSEILIAPYDLEKFGYEAADQE